MRLLRFDLTKHTPVELDMIDRKFGFNDGMLLFYKSNGFVDIWISERGHELRNNGFTNNIIVAAKHINRGIIYNMDEYLMSFDVSDLGTPVCKSSDKKVFTKENSATLIDSLLEKIQLSGFDSLSSQEKKFIVEYSNSIV